jgi:hypothetical protein
VTIEMDKPWYHQVRMRVLVESVVVVGFSIIFWIWAFVISLSGTYEDGNVVKASIDDGLVCFPLTFITGLYGIALCRKWVSSPSVLLGRFIVVSVSVTAAIFIWAAIVTNSTPMHESYLVISCMIWICFGVLYFRDAERLRVEGSGIDHKGEGPNARDSGALSLKRPLIMTQEYTA